MVSISVTVMCVIRLGVKSHMVIHQGIHSAEYSSCGVWSTAFTAERNLLNLPWFFLTFEHFFDVDDDDDSCNLNKMIINSLFFVCTDVSYFC